jgi:phage tail-like protein
VIRTARVLAAGLLLAFPLALGSGADEALAMGDGTTEHFFTVEIGEGQFPFDEMVGIGTETEVVEIRPDDLSVILKRPGRTRWGNITLERGYTATDDLWEWRRQIEAGVADLRAMSIRIDDAAGNPVAQWNFENAWPVKVSGPSVRADAEGQRLVETITFAVDRGELAPATR